jgi:hypothetical protein
MSKMGDHYTETIAGILSAQGFASVLAGKGISFELMVEEDGLDKERGVRTRLYHFKMYGDRENLKRQMHYFFTRADR